MSSGYAHKLVFAVVFAIVFAYLCFTGVSLDGPTLMVAFVMGIVAAVWPDIDIAVSPVSRELKEALFAVVLVTIVIYALFKEPVYLVLACVAFVLLLLLETAHHRRFCHSLLFVGIMTLAAYFVADRVIMPFISVNAVLCALSWFGGQTLHLMADGEFDDGLWG